MDDLLTMHGVAIALGVIGLALAAAAVVCWVVETSERRKWRSARKSLPFILE